MNIWVRNAALELVAQIRPDKLEWRESWMDLCGWTLTISPPADNDRDRDDQLDAIGALLDPGSGLYVEDDNGVVAMSGWSHLTEAGTSTAWKFVEKVNESNGTTEELLEVSGRLDIGVLSDRLAAPDPANGLTGNTVPYDVRYGPASTVVRDLIAVNAGLQARVERQTFGLVIPEVSEFGNTIISTARWPDLLEHLRELCIAGDVTVGVVQDGTALAVSIGEVRNRSDVVIFSSEGRTLQGAEVNSTLTSATAVLVAGQGEGTDRALVERTAGNALRRREHFLDRRDVETIDELATAGDTWLAENGGVVSVSVDPDLDSDGAVFGSDYRLGDLVGVAPLSGAPTLIQRVAAIDVTVTQARVDRRLTLGSVRALEDSTTLDRLDSQAVRLARLERST